jgi:hypothetical protein
LSPNEYKFVAHAAHIELTLLKNEAKWRVAFVLHFDKNNRKRRKKSVNKVFIVVAFSGILDLLFFMTVIRKCIVSFTPPGRNTLGKCG